MHTLPLPPIAPPRIIGLDDWAWKRGQRYGALVVDLERKKPIALLPDRSQQTVVQWLKGYPTITIVARDHSKEFAAAITEALPHAQHVSPDLLCRRASGLTVECEQATITKRGRAPTSWRFSAFSSPVRVEGQRPPVGEPRAGP